MALVTRAAAQIFRDVRSYTRTMRLPSFRGVAAAAISAVIMGMGVTYDSIGLRFTIAGVPATEAEIKAQVTKIKATVDGDPKIDASSTELLAIFNFWGARYGLTNVNDGVLRLELSRPWEQEIVAQDGPGWGMATGVAGGVSTFTLEVTLAGGATIDAIEGFGEVENAAALGRHLCIRRPVVDNQAAAGDKILTDWNTGADYQVLAFHVDKSGGTGNTIREVQLNVDQVEEIQRCVYGQIQARFRRYGCTQQTSFTHIPFDVRGRPLDGLPMVFQDMRLLLSTTLSGVALGNFNVLAEQLEGVDPKPAAA